MEWGRRARVAAGLAAQAGMAQGGIVGRRDSLSRPGRATHSCCVPSLRHGPLGARLPRHPSTTPALPRQARALLLPPPHPPPPASASSPGQHCFVLTLPQIGMSSHPPLPSSGCFSSPSLGHSKFPASQKPHLFHTPPPIVPSPTASGPSLCLTLPHSAFFSPTNRKLKV